MPARCIYRTGIKPGKHSDTRIKPLPLVNDHGRCITATPGRKPVPVGEWPLHIAVIKSCNRSNSEVKRPPGPGSGLKNLGTSRKPYIILYIIVFQGGGDRRGY